jgi:hypothetical protein
VAAGPGGSFFVLDAREFTLEWYDQLGNLRDRVGGEGDGPGEYRWPTSVVVEGDTVWVLAGGTLKSYGIGGTVCSWWMTLPCLCWLAISVV